MHIRRVLGCTATATLIAGGVVIGQNGTPINSNSKNVVTLAVYGDSPYGTSPTDTVQTEKTPAFIDSINNDPKVDFVLQVGDIHSGSQFCTESYDRTIADRWTLFKNPLVYTPGDNEWTDCHKKKQGGHLGVNYADGDPLANLDLVRTIFFANPGYALGGRHKRVLTQAQEYDLAHPSDSEYVENVMWEQSQVLFVTVNVPGGSNNDADPWFTDSPPAETAAQAAARTAEISRRTAADLRWLDAAFTQAQQDGAEAIVIGLQADMWDPEKGSAHVANYKPFINSIAAHAAAFHKPVLLFNGDSHVYRSDNPLMIGAPCQIESGASTTACANDAAATQVPNYLSPADYPSVSNFHRVVVHGSTLPMEWLRLTITPRTDAPTSATAFGPFSWQRVQPNIP
jgi:Calcineurin-like phosphoesterase